MSSGSDGESPVRPSEALLWHPIFCLLRGSGIGFCATLALSKGRPAQADHRLRPEAALPRSPNTSGKHEFQRVRRLRPSENSLLEQRTKTSTILLAPKAAAFLGPRTTTEEHIYGCMSDDWVCIGKVIYLSILVSIYSCI